jgi:hypothetical protein
VQPQQQARLLLQAHAARLGLARGAAAAAPPAADAADAGAARLALAERLGII